MNISIGTIIFGVLCFYAGYLYCREKFKTHETRVIDVEVNSERACKELDALAERTDRLCEALDKYNSKINHESKEG